MPCTGGSPWPTGGSSSTTISCWRRGCRRRTTGCRGGREQFGAVYAQGRGGAAGSHHGPIGAAGRWWARQGRELHDRGGRRDRGGAGGGARGTARDRARRGVSRGQPGQRAHHAGRDGARSARAVRPGPARIRAPGTGQARRGGPSVHRDPGGHPGLRTARQRRLPAQRRRHLGGGGRRPRHGRPVGAAAGSRRPHPGRARPAGQRPRTMFAAGDVALFPGLPLPQLAQPALHPGGKPPASRAAGEGAPRPPRSSTATRG